ncbi:pimeloyl-ACP methyl ester carboxylesterase [Spinactinospora alkalitolerans]|uniref:Pimeloyl-ACP methyl ester carboxylesterase n=1 Tax=Spinactinospora alkalitolerans TaxID=687207 RepID=A0A852TWJ7_9ACTN|nr:hypothetical protein [Spinactinospora alkalitolerans]NYE48101.1 pimeloyl-ACP methyl ester carboxylesterase [Spinactinospora alkalitolerans]
MRSEHGRKDAATPPRRGHGKRLSFYQFGPTTMFASRADQRFSYCLYVPEDYDEDGTDVYPLVVLVHGTGRDAQSYRDAFAGFARTHRCIVFAPLFPAGIGTPGELHNYKYLRYGDIRFDLLLLAMLEEVAESYRVGTARFLLTGFSGGGHFTHRFLYTHPDRLLGASVGAPGVVTLPDEARPWPAGIGGLREALGVTPDLEAIRAVPVQLVIGARDTETWEIGMGPEEPAWIKDVNDHGVDRQARMRALKAGLVGHGVAVRHDIVPGVAHECRETLGPVRAFFAERLAAVRAAEPDGWTMDARTSPPESSERAKALGRSRRDGT